MILDNKIRIIKSKLILLVLILFFNSFMLLNMVNANDNEWILSEIGSITGSRICDVKIASNILYVLDADLGLKTFNVSDPTTPVQLGHFMDTYTFAHSILIDDTYAYIADYEDGLEIINITEPSNLRIIGQYSANVGSTAGSTDVHKSGDLVFLTSQNLGLEIINCSDPFNPIKIGSYYDSHRVIRVYSLNDLVFISEAGNGFKILNITEDGCTEIFHFSDTASTQDFFIHSDVLYTTDGSFGIRLFDINNLSNIVKIGEKAIDGKAYGLVVETSGEQIIAYVATWEEGLQILDISEPEDIQVLAQYTDGGESYNVAISKELAFVADFSDGVEIIQISTLSTTTTKSSPGFKLLSTSIGLILALILFQRRPHN